MANWSGVAATIQAISRPTVLQPNLKVTSIAALDFAAFKSRGITGVVLDKDNCITRPYVDQLEPKLQPAWNELLDTFGAANVLIVSNSAGTRKDSLLLQAESVSRNLLVPVLVHPTPKPGSACAKQVAAYFLPALYDAATSSSIEKQTRPSVVFSPRSRSLARQGLPPVRISRPRLLIIGDRVTTDMILADRIRSLKTQAVESGSRQVDTVSVLTTELHAREGMGTLFLRNLERFMLWIVERKRTEQQANEDNEASWADCLKQGASLQVAAQAKTPITAVPSETIPTRPPLSAALRSPSLLLQYLPKPDVPRFLASLHEPLTRLTSLWRPHVPDSPLSRPSWTVDQKWRSLFSRDEGAVGAAEKAVTETEKLVSRLRQRFVQ